MPPLYLQPELTFAVDAANNPAAVRALQHDLRALGYLRAGIDGNFGPATINAIRALQYDLLNNGGGGSNGSTQVALTSFNTSPTGGNYVSAVNGVFDQNFATVLAQIASDVRIGKLPSSANPEADNQKAIDAIRSAPNSKAPVPFVMAIAMQESGCQHFHVPHAGDEDGFVTVGLDHNDKQNTDHITSRGCGIGQFTFFHQPLSPQEIADVVADPVRNVQQTFGELRGKFDGAVVGKDAAVDRIVEHPLLPLRLCRYSSSDQRYMNDCRNCVLEARKIDITRGTPAYSGASISYQPTQYYSSADYSQVPDRADFLCDWPYAARRYNGAGVNSFHYQIRILLNLLR